MTNLRYTPRSSRITFPCVYPKLLPQSFIFIPCVRRQTHSHLRPPPKGTPANIRIYLIFPQITVIGQHFCRCKYWFIFIQICVVGSKRRIFSATECILAAQGRSGSSKVDDFGTNRKRVYDFLVVLHCNYGPILHRF